MYTFEFLLYYVKLSSNHDKLPSKLDFEEIKQALKLNSSSSEVLPDLEVSSSTESNNVSLEY